MNASYDLNHPNGINVLNDINDLNDLNLPREMDLFHQGVPNDSNDQLVSPFLIVYNGTGAETNGF